MARDKKKDDRLFNCGEKHELKYVSDLYKPNEKEVYDFLKKKCEDGTIYNYTHSQIYDLIKEQLGYPVSN